MIKIILFSLLILVALMFSAQNQQLININYFVAQQAFPLTLVLACTFLIGFISAWLLSLIYVIRLQKQLHQANRATLKQNQDKNQDNSHGA